MLKQLATKRSGFSLIETLLSIVIIGLLAGLSAPIFYRFQAKNDLDVATNTIAQSLRRAQALSQAVGGDSTWGIQVQNGGITLFKGASYALRDASFDEQFNLAASITPSGLQEVVFNKMTGEPQLVEPGTFTLTSTINEIRALTVNLKGNISY